MSLPQLKFFCILRKIRIAKMRKYEVMQCVLMYCGNSASELQSTDVDNQEQEQIKEDEDYYDNQIELEAELTPELEVT
jgi:hypothetical protein